MCDSEIGPYARGVIDLSSDILRVRIAPEIGAGVARFDLNHPREGLVPLMRPASEEAAGFNALASYSLVPWSNRIDQARLRFKGRTYPLRPDWPDGTAIHGDAKHRPWSILDRSPGSVRLALDATAIADRNFPWPYLAEVRYEVRNSVLLTRLSVTNNGTEPFPAGLGFHPFWLRQLLGPRGPISRDAFVRVPLRGHYPCERIMAVGPAVETDVSRRLNRGTTFEGLELDDVFDGFGGTASIQWLDSGVSVRYECSPECGHCVIYSPPVTAATGFFCLEPVTMVNNGINLEDQGWGGTGVQTLRPGETLATTWSICVEVET